ncbi:EAL domain-containing protein [Heliobacterium chlorum]|uniref:Stage 0 sporulation protein A homolog n=1 Tax=Heliobacterium chlorum TaxID=2698 RepID=A0ABR7T4E5_HELCL|nr:EAL domain-containing protein [Heliobacterium chlorum]MBC9785645.1 EAL domain-containing protein [Heliobacterium chlorum]
MGNNKNQTNRPLILVADDDRAMRLVLRRALERDGYSVIEAGDGKEALLVYEQYRPELVLMDVVMPEMDGFTALAHLQDQPGGKVPVLMITGLDDDSSVEQAFQAGAIDYITKPIHWAVLRQRVRRLIEAQRMEQELMARETQLRAIASALGEGLYVIDAEGGLTFLNPEGERILGWTLQELSGKYIHDIIYRKHIDGSAIEAEDCPILKTTRSGNTYRSDEDYFTRKDGAVFPVSLVSTPLMVNDKISGAVAVFQDISERKKVEEQLRLASNVFENTTEGILVTDQEGYIQSVNPAFTISTGYSFEEVNGKKPNIFQSGRHNPEFYKQLWSSLLKTGRWQGEIWNRRKNGELYAAWLTISAICDDLGRATHYAAVFSDITEHKQAQDLIKHQAYHDALTDLPNRLLFIDRLTQALAHAGRNHHMLAVLFLDLDRFKVINDTFGHAVGDQLLQGVARRLRNSVRESDTVARLGGDEFTVLLPQIGNVEDAAKVAQKILSSLRQPWLFSGQQFCTTTSIGIAVFPTDGEEADSLMKNADAAMYRAKEQGRNNYQLYTPALNAWAFERLAMENRLRHALEQNEFVLYYQPKVDAHSHVPVAVEALIRWQHPDIGIVSPTEFLRLAEDSGLIVPIGEWCLRTACEQLRSWLDEGNSPVKLAINLCGRQIQYTQLDSMVKDVLEATRIPPNLVELEIGEEMVLQYEESALTVLNQLKSAGVNIVIEQFGKNCSRIPLLQSLPVSTLKIDPSFVCDLVSNHHHRELIQGFSALAHSLHMKIAAEGVGSLEQVEFLRSVGCDELQGYYFSDPVPATEIPQMFEKGPVAL